MLLCFCYILFIGCNASVQLSEVVKLGAMSLGSGNPDSQVMLIHAVRDVAAALKDLIQATKDASGKHIGDPAMARLKDSAKVCHNEIYFYMKFLILDDFFPVCVFLCIYGVYVYLFNIKRLIF